jgi:aspartyl-tRNA synthetase
MAQDKQASDEAAQAQFGFLMNAFEFGAPPHGGFAFGLDRLVWLLAGGSTQTNSTSNTTIRDVIAFPKSATGNESLTGAPAEASISSLEQLHISISSR